MNLAKKVHWLYQEYIFPRFYHLRGVTRLSKVLRSLAVHDFDPEEDGLYRATIGEIDIVWPRPETLLGMQRGRPCEINILARTAPDALVADVGAYNGLYAIVAAKHGARRVDAFDINQDVLDRIPEHAQWNDAGDIIEPHRLAIGDQDGEVTVDINAATPISSIDQAGDVTVPATTLDRFYQSREYPDIIKIDVEGAEYDVLQGATGIIEAQHPTLLIEIHVEKLHRFDATADDVLQFLRAHGYTYVETDRKHGGAIYNIAAWQK
ncbi:FkbM family methyltransferase [Halogeometricum borinquense]|uniref:FkbM family methyltransferase n=1 Tax=Halogeometricum borinquense TaxID=60847 RepID=A0A6C0UQZ6_9EURY|nr:FkbM family methyltransferase [Halogeometricum borinquense]QIB75368.1 FkbM family methyltransferase [Halogeometricum borinquense]